jgi:hypothetical protein
MTVNVLIIPSQIRFSDKMLSAKQLLRHKRSKKTLNQLHKLYNFSLNFPFDLKVPFKKKLKKKKMRCVNARFHVLKIY